MRDYFVQPAQTNLEFYAQVIEHRYGQSERQRIADAYHFALRQVFPLARGSGKPFIAHLVGTASLVLESGCSDDWVIAALLHALYQRRIPFSGGLAPKDRRRLVARRFGTAVDDLIDRYTEFEGESMGGVTPAFAKANRDVVTLRLADELEDLCGNALALHGGPEEADGVATPGSYGARRAAKNSDAKALLATAKTLDLPGIGRGLSHWLDFSSTPAVLSDMRTGWFSSVDLADAKHPGPEGHKQRRD